jgi:hypothetical protein
MRRASRGSNKNDVPSAAERRALKTWMLGTMGDGITVECAGPCGRQLLFSEITRDRYPVPGRKGGKYQKGNIRPMCVSCNSSDGARALAEERRRRNARNARRRERYAQNKAVKLGVASL